jgi:hypothetical protein
MNRVDAGKFVDATLCSSPTLVHSLSSREFGATIGHSASDCPGQRGEGAELLLGGHSDFQGACIPAQVHAEIFGEQIQSDKITSILCKSMRI